MLLVNIVLRGTEKRGNMDWLAPITETPVVKKKTKTNKVGRPAKAKNPRIQYGVQPEWLKPYSITKDNAVAMHNRRYELARVQAELGIEDAVNENLKNGDPLNKGIGRGTGEAARILAKHAAKIALSSTSTKGLSDILGWLFKTAGYVKEKDEKSIEEMPINTESDVRQLYQIINIYDSRKKQEVIDAVVKDADGTIA